MLSDREREMLADLERELLSQDRQLTRRFESAAKTQRLRSRRRPRLRYDWVLQLVIGLALIVAALALLFRGFGTAVGWATVAGCVAVVRHWLNLGQRLSD